MHPVRNGRGHLGRQADAQQPLHGEQRGERAVRLTVNGPRQGQRRLRDGPQQEAKAGREERRIAEGVRDVAGVVGRDHLGPRVLAGRIRGNLRGGGGAPHDAPKRHGLWPEQDAQEQGGAEVAHQHGRYPSGRPCARHTSTRVHTSTTTRGSWRREDCRTRAWMARPMYRYAASGRLKARKSIVRS